MTDKEQINEFDIAIRNIVKNNFVKVPSYSRYGGFLCNTDMSTSSIAEALYNVGYRKVNEGSIVIPEVFYEDLKHYNSISTTSKLVEKARKETAKEFAEGIIKMLWNRGRAADGKMFEYGDLTSIDVWEIAKQFGVEVEDE